MSNEQVTADKVARPRPAVAPLLPVPQVGPQIEGGLGSAVGFLRGVPGRAMPPPDRRGVRGMLALQRAVGNQAVARRFDTHRSLRSAVIQRFDTPEHKEMGDEATGGAMVELAPGYNISYGDMVALAGDFFGSIDEMRRLAATKGQGKGTREEIEYARHVKAKGKKAAAVGFSQEAKDAVDARYFRLAANNRSHFANATTADSGKTTAQQAAEAPDPDRDAGILGIRNPPWLPNAIIAYRYYHVRAMLEAARSGAAGGNVAAALATEAFGAHFLTDSFAAGHVRTERQSIKDYWNAKVPMFLYNLKGFMGEGAAREISAMTTGGGGVRVRSDVLYGAAKGKISEKLDAIGGLGLGDVVSGALHDVDNQGGIAATSDSLDVTLHGDTMAGKSDEKRLATEAVAAGFGEVRQAFFNGTAMKPEDVVRAALGPEGLFAPEYLIPEAKPDSEQAAGHEKPKWEYATPEELFADPKFVRGAAMFASTAATEIRVATAEEHPAVRMALEDGFTSVLLGNPIGTLRTVINWTPTLTDSALGHNTDDRSNDYWAEAKKTPGGLASLTMPQRERLIGRLLSGWTHGDDEDAIMDILRSAGDSNARTLIKKFGWSRIEDSIDDTYWGEQFKSVYPEDKYK